MGLRTFNVKSAGGRSPSGVLDPEYGPNVLKRDANNELYYQQSEMQLDEIGVEIPYKDETIGSISRLPKDGPELSHRADAVDLILPEDGGEYPEDPKTGSGTKYRQGAAALKAVGGIINAYSAHSNFVTENNMKMFQSQLQQNYIRADASRAILREGTKATDRKGQALISAVAQGQAASGDIAQTAMSNEDVYAAQNAMNIEINAMRAIYGLQSDQLNMESNNRLSKINRDASIAQSIIGGASSFAMAGS